MATAPGSLFSQNPLAGLLSLVTGGASGFFPTPGNSNSQGTSNTQTYGGSQQSLQSLLQSLQQTSGTSGQQGTQSSSTTPTVSPQTQALLDQLTKQYGALASSTPDLKPYQAQQTQQINTNRGLQGKAVDNIMAARGLSTSPVSGTAQAGVENSRVGDITNLQQSLPLLLQQLKSQNLAAAGNFASSLPRGSTTTGTSGQTGYSTQQQSGSQTGNSSQYGSQYGTSSNQSAQNTQTSQGGGIGSGLGGIASLLAGLFL